jgi:hypothetical protein
LSWWSRGRSGIVGQWLEEGAKEQQPILCRSHEKLPIDDQEIEVEMREGWGILGYLTALRRQYVYKRIRYGALLRLHPPVIKSMLILLLVCIILDTQSGQQRREANSSCHSGQRIT